MTKKKSERDHTLADRSYLRGYISSILSIENGAYQLGNMISNAESAAELLNYDEEHIAPATKAMLEQAVLGSTHSIAHSGIGKFAKTLKKDPELYEAFTEAFGAAISDSLPTISAGEHSDHNLAILKTLVSEHPQLKGAWDTALKAQEKAKKTIEKAASPAPSHQHPV
mgnify:CR=1 FL=1